MVRFMILILIIMYFTRIEEIMNSGFKVATSAGAERPGIPGPELSTE